MGRVILMVGALLVMLVLVNSTVAPFFVVDERERAIKLLDAGDYDFCYEGEMNIDTALDPDLRARILPGNRMEGAANVLVFAHADAASGVRNILKMKGGGLEVGPILMGMGNKAHIVSQSITARGLLNVSAIAGTPVDVYG